MTVKKKYEKPAMQVYDLPQHPQLLAGSNKVPGNHNYPDGGDPFSF